MNADIENNQNILDEDDLPLSVFQRQPTETRSMAFVIGKTIPLLQASRLIEYTVQDVDKWNEDEDST